MLVELVLLKIGTATNQAKIQRRSLWSGSERTGGKTTTRLKLRK
jgi:hypothetical protein